MGGVLFGGVVDQHVEPAKGFDGSGNRETTEVGMTEIPGNGDATAADAFYTLPGIFDILMLVQIDDCHIGTFFGNENAHRSADAAVSPGDESYLAQELALSPVAFVFRFRQ